MSEKRFIISKNTGERFPTGIIDVERQTHLWVVEVVDLLNELVKDNEELGISIKLFEDDVATKDKKIDEQQATISQLQDLCGESDGENAKLRIENKKLKEENEQLKKENEKLGNIHLSIDLTYSCGYGGYIADVRVVDV